MFSAKSSLVKHVNVVHRSLRFVCTACSSTFTSRSSLTIHTRKRCKGVAPPTPPPPVLRVIQVTQAETKRGELIEQNQEGLEYSSEEGQEASSDGNLGPQVNHDSLDHDDDDDEMAAAANRPIILSVEIVNFDYDGAPDRPSPPPPPSMEFADVGPAAAASETETALWNRSGDTSGSKSFLEVRPFQHLSSVNNSSRSGNIIARNHRTSKDRKIRKKFDPEWYKVEKVDEAEHSSRRIKLFLNPSPTDPQAFSKWLDLALTITGKTG